MHDGKPCGRPIKDGNKCICHSEKESKVIRLFQQELDKIFADASSMYYDLTGFVFPKEGYKLPKEYNKETYFRGAKFWGEADFDSATFSGGADFVGATFSGEADFYKAKFSGYALFSRAKFSGYALFSRATFSGEAGFVGATFSRITWFYSTRFEKHADLSYCKVGKDAVVTFDGQELQKKNKDMFSARAYFMSCTFAEPKNVKFRKVSLGKCAFLETDLSGVQFVGATWAKKPKFFRWFPRNAVYDELAQNPEHKLIEQLYRRLQINYVNNYRYSEAGDFYIGEQEMMRKAKGSGWKVWRRIVCTNFIYKWISYYGQSFLLPLFWMLAVLFLFPIYLIYDGIIKSGYWNAFWKNLSFVTFNRADISKYVTEPYQQGIVTIEGLLLVVLVTFFILALRRKYKRKTF